MSTSEALDQLRSRILAEYPALFLKTWEEERWEEEIATLALEIERGLVLWSVTEGPMPPIRSVDRKGPAVPLDFLEEVMAYPEDHLFLVKDFDPYLKDPVAVRKLRDLFPQLNAQNKTLLFIGADFDIPVDLQKEALAVDLPLPGYEELRVEFQEVLASRGDGPALDYTDEEEERMLKAVLGLTAREARKALARATLGREKIDEEVYSLLVSEKKHLVQGSDLLEFYELDEGVDAVGGLGSLKDWLRQRSRAFSTEAEEQGIPSPKGVLLLGVQGCGKSLTARATAKLLSFPLVRLDVANLLSGERGSSEGNMRDVLRLMETIAPAVLWLDEIEKGFAGLAGDANVDATMSRIFGKFLTWMEERRAPVFVVATANSVDQLPPELLRRGRFDELFFVDLPNYEERKHIFQIHLEKRGWNPEKYDLGELASSTEAYSGSEIEQIVVSAMVETYSTGAVMTQDDLHAAREEAVPLSTTMEEKVFNLREWARGRCRQATPDSRVVQMLEEEDRMGGPEVSFETSADTSTEWVSLAEYGQIKAAIVAYVNRRDRVTFSQLLEAFSEYTETAGDQGIALKSDPNIVLWVGMHQAIALTLVKLIAAKRLYLHKAHPELYKERGEELELPMLNELPEERTNRPHWYPVYLTNFPSKTANARLGRVARMKLSR